MSAVALLPAQRNEWTTSFDALLQAYSEWWKRDRQSSHEHRGVSQSQKQALYKETTRLAKAALYWAQKPPGLWRYCWVNEKGEIVSLTTHHGEHRQGLEEESKISGPPMVFYELISNLLNEAIQTAPAKAEKRYWAEQLLDISLKMHRSPQLQRGVDFYHDPFGGPQPICYATDFSYEAGIRREQYYALTSKVPDNKDPREWCYEVARRLRMTLTSPNPCNEPLYFLLVGKVCSDIVFARENLALIGSLPSDDWVIIAGWHLWRLPQDTQYLKVRKRTLYLSLQALQVLKVRHLLQPGRLVVWYGSRQGEILLDGHQGFVEGDKVWVQVKALSSKAGVFDVRESERGQIVLMCSFDTGRYFMYPCAFF